VAAVVWHDHAVSAVAHPPTTVRIPPPPPITPAAIMSLA
jgi:hypothetical protein